MKFVIVGINGKMGNAVRSVLYNSEDVLVAGIDIEEDFSKNIYNSVYSIKEKFDAIIDFSTAISRKEIINFCYKNKITYGCFATNVSKDDEMLLKQLSKTNKVLLCDNASYGVHIMKKIAHLLSTMAVDADYVLTEYHHKQKKDAPSGTAKSLINILNKNNVECSVSSYRVGDEVGTHCLEVFLNNEKLTITHQATNRNVFAYGAVKLMHKLEQKTCGLYVGVLD